MKMKRYISWVLAVIMTAAFAFHTLSVLAKAAAPGEWVLVDVEDKNEEDYHYEDNSGGKYSASYPYSRSNFGIEWTREERSRYDEIFYSEGSLSAGFSAMPERVPANETVTITAVLSSSFSENPVRNTGGEPFNQVEINILDRAYEQNIYDRQYELPRGFYRLYELPSEPKTPYEFSEAINFSLADGLKTGHRISFVFTLHIDGLSRKLETIYTYEWVSDDVPLAAFIELKGAASSAEGKPMYWMHLSAQIFYGQEQYEEKKQPDAEYRCLTDLKGAYRLEIPVKENGDGAELVGIRLTARYQAYFPYEPDSPLFSLHDMSHPASSEDDPLELAVWLVIDPNEYAGPFTEDAGIEVYRFLFWAFMDISGWSFDVNGVADAYVTEDMLPVERYMNYSVHYTGAFCAWYFGGAHLREYEALLQKPVRIEMCSEGGSRYNSRDNAIRISAVDSGRGDEPRFAMLHEFGHAFDFITNGSHFRGDLEFGAGDVNHGGYLNSSTSDSYVEGFATAYAAMVQRAVMKLPDPASLSWINLAFPASYSAYSEDLNGEELSIAAWLYRMWSDSHEYNKNYKDFWDVIKVDLKNFNEYYEHINSSVGLQLPVLPSYAKQLGLYKMPEGNGRYDPGEPYRDVNKNGRWDPGEPYGDLMWEVNPETGRIDFSMPIREFEQNEPLVGTVADAGRPERNSSNQPQNSFLHISGEKAEYLVVRVLPDVGHPIATLSPVTENRVYIPLPGVPSTGRVEVLVPGGKQIYLGDIAALQQRFHETLWQSVPLAEADIDASQLAPAGTRIAMGVYGDPAATGAAETLRLPADEWKAIADGYAEDLGGGDLGGEGFAGMAVLFGTQGSAPDFPNSALMVIFAVCTVIAAAAILIVIQKRRRRASPAGYPAPHQSGANSLDQAPAADRKFCKHCGKPLPAAGKFCSGCGQSTT